MTLSDFFFTDLNDSVDVTKFNCDDDDINEFLKIDARRYQLQKMANTYVFLEEDDEIAAFFCISNDCLNDLGDAKGYNNSIWNRFHRKQRIPNDKRIKQYPSIKIGRLGVSSKYHGTGLSYELMSFIKGFSTLEHKPAVRLLLLDAYNKPKQIKYYERNGFVFMLNSDQDSKTRLMLYDLKNLE